MTISYILTGCLLIWLSGLILGVTLGFRLMQTRFIAGMNRRDRLRALNPNANVRW